jgi:hypothetical protein
MSKKVYLIAEVSAKEKCSYNLAYFNLWWRRMLREG